MGAAGAVPKSLVRSASIGGCRLLRPGSIRIYERLLEAFPRMLGFGRGPRSCQGTVAWADAALAFGWDVLGQWDIRELKGHLDGREQLLDGSWQLDQLNILEAKRLEDTGATA
jgi:hypothetical protein